VHILALGQAAHQMAAAAVVVLRDWGMVPASGVIIAPELQPSPHPALRVAIGDHPIPGAQSRAASLALGQAVRSVQRGDEAWVLLSGGATSLAAAPIDGIGVEDFEWLFAHIVKSGLDIRAINRIRKRFARWGAGRLAVALAGASIRLFVVSDVVGDDLLSIGSGPCVPDPSTAAEIRTELEATSLWSDLPPALREHLGQVEAGRLPETPKPEAPVFDAVTGKVVSGNRTAVLAAARQAELLGFETVVNSKPLVGDATAAGRKVAEWILTRPAVTKHPDERPWCMIWGGETTVVLTGPHGRGGRCQELALAAAERLTAHRSRPGLRVLALGTDGRDGPTDAAGGVVDAETWEKIKAAGIDPAAALAGHDAYPALDAAGALVKLGLTGTNVMDLVIAMGVGVGG
ncbi:MAG: glycerate kinase type-2 family protein, partial [Gemmatimonadales bacterium]